MKQTLYKVLMTVFEITLPLFLLMGTVLVFTQLFGAIIGNGALVLGVNSAIKLYATWLSCICAFSAFFLSYLREKKK